MNWLLISGISSALNMLEEHENWDLSIGETAKLLESFYCSLESGLPKTRDEWITIFNNAHVYCWGKDHECDATKDSELEIFILSMADCYEININPLVYITDLGISCR